MGLITGLLTLPLAPVRGTMWIAERILEIDAARQAGELSEQDAAEAEDILLERLIAARR